MQGLIYLTYNSEHAIRVYLPRLLLFKDEWTQIIAIDNASSDNSVSAMESLGIDAIVNEENVGYSKAINQGIQEAIELGWDWIHIINPDVGVYPDWDKRMISGIPDDAGIVGYKMLSPDGNIHHAGGTVLTHRIQQSMPAMVAVENTDYAVYSEIPYCASSLNHMIGDTHGNVLERVPWVTFAAVSIRTQIVDEIGLLNEDMFLYNSDAEFCLRLWGQSEIWAVYYKNVQFEHVVQGSSPKGSRTYEIIRKDAQIMRGIEKELIEKAVPRYGTPNQQAHT